MRASFAASRASGDARCSAAACRSHKERASTTQSGLVIKGSNSASHVACSYDSAFHLTRTSQPGLCGAALRATKRSGWLQAGSANETGGASAVQVNRFLKLSTLRLAICMRVDSGTHSLWMWDLPTYFTKNSGSLHKKLAVKDE